MSDSGLVRTIDVEIVASGSAFLGVGTTDIAFLDDTTVTIWVDARDNTGAAEGYSITTAPNSLVATAAIDATSGDLEITGVDPGTTDLTITSGSGVTKTIYITVDPSGTQPIQIR